MEPQKPVANKWGWNNIHIYTDARTNGNAIPNVWGFRASDLVRRFWRFGGRTNGCTYFVYVWYFVSCFLINVFFVPLLLCKERNNSPAYIPHLPTSAYCYAYLCTLRVVFLRNRSSDDQNASICILAIAESECRHMFASLTNNLNQTLCHLHL